MIIGVVTTKGQEKSIEALGDGWKIVPRGFAVSDDGVSSPGDVFDPVAAAARIFSTWKATIVYTTNDSVWPITKNGFYYECTTAGTSGGSEPVFPTTRGNTVADGTVVWTCRGLWYDVDYPTGGDGQIASRVIVDADTIIFNCTVPPGVTLLEKDAKEVFLFAEAPADTARVLTGDQDDGQVDNGYTFFDGDATFQTDGVTAGMFLKLLSGSFIGTYELLEVVDENTLKLNGLFTVDTLLTYEIYEREPFLLALGGPDVTVVYDYEGSTTFRLGISIANSDIASTYDFQYTQAAEIAAHDENPNAHPEIQTRLELFGMFIQGTADLDFEYRGQHINEDAVFDVGVADKNAVYKNANGNYYQALADGTDKANVVGIADLTNGIVISGSGFVDTGIVFTADGAKVYLSDTTPGLITETVTNTLLGFVIAKADGIILLGTTGGGGGTLSVSESYTHEDELYSTWLSKSSFLEVKYDKFGDPGTVTIGGDATYNSTEHRYDGTLVGVATIESGELLPDTSTRYRFEINTELTTGTTVTAEYNIGAGWVSANLNEVVTIDAGFTTLKVKLTFTADGAIESFGVLYNETGFVYQTDTRMFETYIVLADSVSPNVITLPSNALYTVDGKSLEVYFRGVRLINGVDFTEDNNSQVTLLKDVSTGDPILFTEKIGYVDTSIDNKIRLDQEHEADGSHTFPYIAEEDIFTDDEAGGLLISASFNEWDISSYVPAGYRYVILNIILQNAVGAASDRYVYMRPKGSTVTDGLRVLSSRRGAYGIGQECVQAIVPIGTSGTDIGKLEYKLNDIVDITGLEFIVQGYIK